MSFWDKIRGWFNACETSGPRMCNFTPRAQQVLALARKEADRLHHDFVGTEHLLLGLFKLRNGVATNVLQNLGLNLEAARLQIESLSCASPDPKQFGNIPFTPGVKHVLELASEQAKALQHTYVSTEHILLGLLLEGDGIAAKVVLGMGISIKQVREEILKELDLDLMVDCIATTEPSPVQLGSAFDTDLSGNFTPRAQQVLALARIEANRFQHNFVGTEHLLLGVIKLGQGTAVTVLQKMGHDLGAVRFQIEHLSCVGQDQSQAGNIPYTPRVKKVLALASREAKALKHTYLGTEHILLGLLREGDGVAAKLLRSLGVDIEQVRQEIQKELSPVQPVDRIIFPEPPQAYRVSASEAGLSENFTPRAQRVLGFAREEASLFNDKFVGPEHVLLGLMKLGGGVAFNVLQKQGIDYAGIRLEIGNGNSVVAGEKEAGNIPFTPSVKRALSFASEEAKALNHTYVGTEHVLLGLIREGDGVAAKVLQGLGIDPKRVRHEIMKELDPHFPPQS